jgi:sterol desaturase/sphingolipid hydroxylase (fatty acid hydroxylase superfamily)
MFADFFSAVYHDFISFWQLDGMLDILRNGDYQRLLTLDGIRAFISPIIPFLLLIEIGRAIVYRRFKLDNYRQPFLIFVFNRFVSRYLSIAMVSLCIGLFEKYALINTSFTWYWLIYGYIIWEFAHFIYHFLAHKIRLFWCLHSTHHAPESMNLSVSYAHFFLEAPYADAIRTSICILAGVNPALLFLVMFIDGAWGTFIHIGDEVMKDARLGPFNKWILTPSHHRVHHARNPLYMDTNFCNLLNIWDRVFGTLQPELKELPVEYGVTRKINPRSFWDVYFGEISFLARDVWAAPGIKNKILYLLIKPPGWSHTGTHKTAAGSRKAALETRLTDHLIQAGPTALAET